MGLKYYKQFNEVIDFSCFSSIFESNPIEGKISYRKNVLVRNEGKDGRDQGRQKEEHLSEDGSEESKIFRELDAEIDEIIRL